MPSKLDPHVVTIEYWLAAEPQLTALAIVGRLNEKHPEQFGIETTFDRAASAEGAQEEGCREVHCSEAALRRDDRYPIARACGRLGL
jgi:hypothetical protein